MLAEHMSDAFGVNGSKGEGEGSWKIASDSREALHVLLEFNVAEDTA